MVRFNDEKFTVDFKKWLMIFVTSQESFFKKVCPKAL